MTVLKIDRKTAQQTKKDVKYYMEFIDSFKFVWASLSNLTNNLFEKLHQKI